MFPNTYIHKCNIHIYMQRDMNIDMYMDMYRHVYEYMHEGTYIHKYIHIYIHVNMCIYMHNSGTDFIPSRLAFLLLVQITFAP